MFNARKLIFRKIFYMTENREAHRVIVHNQTFSHEVTTGILNVLPLLGAKGSAVESDGKVVVTFPALKDKRTFINLANAATESLIPEGQLKKVDEEIIRRNGGVKQRIVDGKIYTVTTLKPARRTERRTGRTHIGKGRVSYVGNGKIR